MDGFLCYPSAVYTVPYCVMVPKEVDNLLLPVPVSGSHIGFSTLRMEPCWMAMGQAAGIASALSIDGKVKVHNIDLSRLQDKLVDQKATLMYFKDVDNTSPHFRMVQYLDSRYSRMDCHFAEPVDAAHWPLKKLSGTDSQYRSRKDNKTCCVGKDLSEDKISSHSYIRPGLTRIYIIREIRAYYL